MKQAPPLVSSPVLLPADPEEATRTTVQLLEVARCSVCRLAEIRARHKLSFSKTANVARELGDLIRVLSVYNRPETI